MVIPGVKGMGLGTFLKRLAREISDDTVTDSAAQLSYYFLFALFPFLFFLVTLTAYLPIQQSVDELMARLQPIMPGEALRLVSDHLNALVNQPKPQLLTVGLLVAIWSASRGVDATRKGLNLAYDVKEHRPWWKVQLIAVGVTLLTTILVLLAVTMVLLGGKAGFWLFDKLEIGQQFVMVWTWLRWPFTAVVVMLAAAMGYYFLPDVKQKFKFITPGSVVGTLVWLLATFGFTQYAEHFGKYNITYGSLGSVVVLMTWLYITGLVFLVGGEMNAIVEHASAEGKAQGARKPGQAPPPKEARPSAVPPGAAKSAQSGPAADAGRAH
jgi:membrane protein